MFKAFKSKSEILTAAIFAACISATPAVSAQKTEAKPATIKAAAKAITPPTTKTVSTAMPEKVTATEGITEYKLPNGLRVLMFPDQSKPTALVNMTYMVGSRHENYGETGMAHLLEHLLFKGTAKNPDIATQHSKRGMRYNASTSQNRTNYFQLFQSSEENLDWALQLEADRMVNSPVAKKDLDTEMTVVRNEYESGENNPVAVLVKRLQSVAYDWHNYGNSTIGNRSDIENVKIENLQAFYRQYYQPDNAVLMVAGKFDEAKTLALIGKYYGAIPKPTRALPKLWTVEPTQDGERQFYVRRKGDFQAVVLGYKMPGALHPDNDAISFINFMLADTANGRLHKELVTTGKAVQVLAFPFSGTDGTLHLAGAIVKKGEPIEPVQTALTNLVENFAKNPPTKAEMDRVRQNIANASERALTNHESIGLQMSEYIALGDWRLFFHARDIAINVTAEQVVATAAKYYKRDNRVTGIFQPEDTPQRAEIAEAPTAAEVLKNFKGKDTVSLAEVFDPSNTNIDKRTKTIDIGGMRVSLLSKKTRGETVNVRIRIRAGDEKSLFGKSTISQFTGSLLSRGTSKFTRAQLADEFTKLKIVGSVSGGNATVNGTMQTTKANLADAIKLAAHVMREPSFPESEFEELRKQSLTNIESQKSDPSALASVALSQHFNTVPRGHPRYSPTLAESEEDIKAVTLAQIKAFHKQFYAADKGEIAIVGDFDEAAVIAVLKEAFANWKGATAYVREITPYQAVAPTNRAIETPDKENGTFLARLNIDMNDEDADAQALTIANYILGGGAGFDSRLTVRIRVKDGLSYGVGSNLSISATDRSSAFVANAIAAPQNINKVEAAFKDEVAKALKDGFTDAEVAAAKSGVLQQRLQSRAQDAGLASSLANNLYFGRTYAFSAASEAKIAALTTADVNAALRKHIVPANITIIKAADFAKVAATKEVNK
jgi:zinc protease